MHFLIRLLLEGLSPKARVLCVGVGIGAEVLSLAAAHPEWRFLGIPLPIRFFQAFMITGWYGTRGD